MRLRPQGATLRQVGDLRPGAKHLLGAATDGLDCGESGHLLDCGVPQTDDPVALDEHDAVRDVLHDEGGSRTLLGRAVEARVVDCHRRAPSEVHREVEIVSS